MASEAQAPVENSGNEVSLRTEDPQRVLTRLLEWAEREGLELGGLDVHRPSLEDVFLQLTAEDDARG